MNTKPLLTRGQIGSKCIAAALSVVIAVSLLESLTNVFQRDGTPFEQVVAAERACTGYVFVSERESCVQSALAAARTNNVASR